MTRTRTVKELAGYLGGVVQGDGTVEISGLGSLETAAPDAVTFLANPRYASKVAETSAGAVLMAPGGERYGRTAIEVANPYLGFAKLLTLFYTAPHEPKGVLPAAIVSETATIGEGASIYPGACIGRNVVIGNRTVIHSGAVLYDDVIIGEECTIHANAVVRERCRIGSRCIIQPGAVIGSDGFGYAPDGSGYYAQARPSGTSDDYFSGRGRTYTVTWQDTSLPSVQKYMNVITNSNDSHLECSQTLNSQPHRVGVSHQRI